MTKVYISISFVFAIIEYVPDFNTNSRLILFPELKYREISLFKADSRPICYNFPNSHRNKKHTLCKKNAFGENNAILPSSAWLNLNARTLKLHPHLKVATPIVMAIRRGLRRFNCGTSARCNARSYIKQFFRPRF